MPTPTARLSRPVRLVRYLQVIETQAGGGVQPAAALAAAAGTSGSIFRRDMRWVGRCVGKRLGRQGLGYSLSDLQAALSAVLGKRRCAVWLAPKIAARAALAGAIAASTVFSITDDPATASIVVGPLAHPAGVAGTLQLPWPPSGDDPPPRAPYPLFLSLLGKAQH